MSEVLRYKRTFSNMCMGLVFSMCLTFVCRFLLCFCSFFCPSVSTYLLLHCIVWIEEKIVNKYIWSTTNYQLDVDNQVVCCQTWAVCTIECVQFSEHVLKVGLKTTSPSEWHRTVQARGNHQQGVMSKIKFWAYHGTWYVDFHSTPWNRADC